MPIRAKTPMVSTTETSKVTPFLGVDYSVLLPRERSECVEILLERFPKGLAFPLHQHKECEQTYLFLEGEAEVNLAGSYTAWPRVAWSISHGSLTTPLRTWVTPSWFMSWSRRIRMAICQMSRRGIHTLTL